MKAETARGRAPVRLLISGGSEGKACQVPPHENPDFPKPGYHCDYSYNYKYYNSNNSKFK